MRRIAAQIATAGALASLVACGGGSSYGGSNNPSPITGSPGPVGATINIANGVVNPSTVTVTVGQSVRFTNNDSTGRQIASNAHPAHTDCPQINALGVIGPGETKETNAFSAARTCSFHEHLSNDGIAGLRGSIVIQ